NLPQIWTIVAVVIGSGSVLSQGIRGGALFTLSMPASRNRLLGFRAAAGLGELIVLAFVPPLVLTLASPAVGASYAVADALVHSTCLFAAGTVWFSVASLLSTSFDDVSHPLLIALAAAMVLAVCEQVLRMSRYS